MEITFYPMCHLIALALIWNACASNNCISDQASTYLCHGQCMVSIDSNVQFIEIDDEINSLSKINDEFVVNHIISSDGTFEETEACTSMPSHKSNMLHLSCITTYRNDASKYGVLEDYVFDEDCTSFTKVVRAYADKEDSEDFSKFQVCNLKCVLE